MYKFAIGWLEKLASIYVSSVGERRDEASVVTDELFVLPDELAPYFIEPDLQQMNPADDEEGENSFFRTPAFTFLQSFISGVKKSDGRRQLFILADAGMGKTSLIAMIKLGHINKFWPNELLCVVKKLGPKTLRELELLKNRDKTILLLDALDEDKMAFGRVKPRMMDILKATQNFYRVIISCRTQFFPRTDNPTFWRQDRVQIDGFTCPVKYLSLFSDSQVDDYLLKKLKKRKEDIPKAKTVLRHMNDLCFRPMLLAYIDDLIETKASNIYQVYCTMVDAWLNREVRKPGTTIKKDQLLNASIHLARWMFVNGERVVSKHRINTMLRENIEISHLKEIEVGGRALLNKNSDGGFRFAHLSFQEFLLVESLKKHSWPNGCVSTEMINRFIRFANLENPNLCGASFINGDLQGFNLRNSNLNKANFDSSNLCGSDLRRASLIGASLNNATLDFAILSDARLINASIKKSRLIQTEFDRANMTDVTLDSSNFEKSSMIEANLAGASLKSAKLNEVNFKGANFTNVDLGNAELTGANLEGICNWRLVKSFEDANIKGVLGAPCGFREFAIENGAIEPSDDDKLSRTSK